MTKGKEDIETLKDTLALTQRALDQANADRKALSRLYDEATRQIRNYELEVKGIETDLRDALMLIGKERLSLMRNAGQFAVRSRNRDVARIYDIEGGENDRHDPEF